MKFELSLSGVFYEKNDEMLEEYRKLGFEYSVFGSQSQKIGNFAQSKLGEWL
jgi:hypothetical protein